MKLHHMLMLFKYYLKILNYTGNNNADIWDNSLLGSLSKKLERSPL